MNLIRSLLNSTVTAVALSVTPVGTLSAEPYQWDRSPDPELRQELTEAGFSPEQATFMDRCIQWVNDVRPGAAEADVWMLCANALVRFAATEVEANPFTTEPMRRRRYQGI